MKNESYGWLKDGKCVPEKYSLGFIRMLLDPAEQKKVAQQSGSHCWMTLYSFLHDRGIDNPGSEHLSAIAELVCGPVVSRPRAERVDHLCDLITMLGAFLKQGIQLGTAVRRVADEAALREAVRWLFIDFGRQTSRRPGLPWVDAIRVAQDRQQIALEEYQRRAIDWWQFNPWTVVFTRCQDVPASMSIVLPVKLRTYNSILEGRRNTYECTAAELEPLSSLIVIEALAPRPAEQAINGENPTLSMFLTLTAQVGALSRCDRLGKDDALKLLSFAAMPLTRKRLISQGFVPTGVEMANSNMELLERVLRVSSRRPHDFIFQAVLNQFSKAFDSPPPD